MGKLTTVIATCAATLAPALACAQAAPPKTGGSAKPGIYTCTTPDGRRLTSDRPIPDCNVVEQRVLNSDGSLRAVLPPAMSPEQRAAHEAKERKLEVERLALADAVRRDRNLMMRFPNEAAHRQARESSLDDANKARLISERRIKDLALERKPLLDEAEFYKGKPLPSKLKQQLDANDAAVDAQKQLIENQKAELVRISGRYDLELLRLKRLWAGAAPGTLGSLGNGPADTAASAPR
jgi:hypothetical protein